MPFKKKKSLRDKVEAQLDDVADKLPTRTKRKRSRLKRVALLGILTGAGAAAVAAVRRQANPPAAPVPFPQPARPATSSAASRPAATKPVAKKTAAKKAPAKKTAAKKTATNKTPAKKAPTKKA